MILSTRRKGWIPLVLRWRRRRDLRPIFKAARVTTRVSMSFFPSVHFHYTTYVSNRNHVQHAVQRIFSATTVKRERVLVERRYYSQMNTNLIQRINQISTQRSSKHVSLFAWSKERAPIPVPIQQPRQSASFTSPFLTLNIRRVERTAISQTHSHIRQHHSQTQSFRSERDTLVKSAQIYFNRAEELVWRRTLPRTTTTENVVETNNPETTYRQTVRPAAAVETHVQTAAPTSNPTTPQQITSFDPRLLDRLTDDVIRRVEKRALVERQRRGL